MPSEKRHLTTLAMASTQELNWYGTIIQLRQNSHFMFQAKKILTKMHDGEMLIQILARECKDVCDGTVFNDNVAKGLADYEDPVSEFIGRWAMQETTERSAEILHNKLVSLGSISNEFTAIDKVLQKVAAYPKK
jgi:hypothetical protein